MDAARIIPWHNRQPMHGQPFQSATKGGRAKQQPVRMVEVEPSTHHHHHHHSQFAADIIEPSHSELIHDSRVLDLVPVIEDQTDDPLWDGFGTLDREQNVGFARSCKAVTP